MTGSESQSWLALDVGGANLKAAHSRGPARSMPFELWKQPEQLPRMLANLAHAMPPFDRLALTMTAELCDCYNTKDEGVREIVRATLPLTNEENIQVWGIDGRFHPVREIMTHPALAAAANWLALAHIAARFAADGPAILIDIGTTTTDLIPLQDRQPVPSGRTDTERLQTSELVYAGIQRTPVCAITPEVQWRGKPTGLCAELFATTHDVYLILEECQADPANLRTADGRPATPQAARDRLARMVGADRATFLETDAQELARALDSALLDRLTKAAKRTMGPDRPPRSAVISGSGQFLAHRLARALLPPGAPVGRLASVWGPAASEAACAHALLTLAAEQPGNP